MKKLLLLTMSLFVLTACAAKTGTMEDNSPEATVTRFFDNLITGNYDEAAKYTYPERAALPTDNGSSILYNAYFPTLSYGGLELAPIEKTVQDWGYVVVFLEVNAKDMDLVLPVLWMSFLMNSSRFEDASEYEIAAFVTKLLRGSIKAAPAISTALTIKLVPNYNGGYTIINADELLDDLALSPLLKLLKHYGGL